MARVDPFVIRIPLKLINDPELSAYFNYLDRFLHDIWVRTGAGTDSVSESLSGFTTTLNSEIFDIRQQIGSGIPVTIDTTGFTVDTTEQTTDLTVS